MILSFFFPQSHNRVMGRRQGEGGKLIPQVRYVPRDLLPPHAAPCSSFLLASNTFGCYVAFVDLLPCGIMVLFLFATAGSDAAYLVVAFSCFRAPGGREAATLGCVKSVKGNGIRARFGLSLPKTHGLGHNYETW